MLKQAWRSYSLYFHPSRIEKVKNSKYHTSYRVSMGLLILSIIVWDIWLPILHFVPIGIMSWTSMDGGIRIGKKMFLAPMRKQDREDYIRCLLLFHIGVPIFIGFLIEIIRSFALGIDIWETLGRLLCYLFAGIGAHVHADGIDKVDGRAVPAYKDKDGKLKWSWINTATVYGGAIAIIVHDNSALSLIDPKFPTYLLGFCVVLFFIWSVIILATQYRPMIEYITDYDRVNGLSVKDRYIEAEQ